MGVGVARGQGSSWKNAGGAEDMVTEEDNVSTQGSPPTSQAEHESQTTQSLPRLRGILRACLSQFCCTAGV